MIKFIIFFYTGVVKYTTHNILENLDSREKSSIVYFSLLLHIVLINFLNICESKLKQRTLKDLKIPFEKLSHGFVKLKT